MTNLDSLDYIVQDLRCQFRDISIVLDGRVDFPSLHALGKGLDLLHHIGIEHIVIDPVGFGAFFGVLVVVHTEVNVRCPVQ